MRGKARAFFTARDFRLLFVFFKEFVLGQIKDFLKIPFYFDFSQSSAFFRILVLTTLCIIYLPATHFQHVSLFT